MITIFQRRKPKECVSSPLHFRSTDNPLVYFLKVVASIIPYRKIHTPYGEWFETITDIPQLLLAQLRPRATSRAIGTLRHLLEVLGKEAISRGRLKE